MTLILKSPITGGPIEIKNPLLSEHVEVGRLLWYTGFTSVGSWDCPAVITRVNYRRRRFRVRSLDDLVEQSEQYPFKNKDEYADSRGSMRLTTLEEVLEYLRNRRLDLKESVEDARKTLKSREKAFAHFDEVCKTILNRPFA